MIEKFEPVARKVVALCITHLNGESELKIYNNLNRLLKQAGYNMLVFCSFDDTFRQDPYSKGDASVFQLIPYDSLSAVIIATRTIKIDKYYLEIAEKAKKAGVPVISIDGTIEGCHNITFDYTDSMEAIVRHIVEDHGCRKVNFIAGFKGNSFSDDRLASYRKVLQENNIPIEEKRIGYGDFWEEPTKKVMKKFLAESSLPDAIICANDTMAMTACECLNNAGYTIPEDVLVTGLDGIDAEKYHTPRLTTATIDYPAACRLAVNIIKKLEDEYIEPSDHLIKPKIVKSQSCGCEKKSITNANEQVLKLFSQMMGINSFHEHMGNMISTISGCSRTDDAMDKLAHYSTYLNVTDMSFYGCDNFLSDTVEQTNNACYSEISMPLVEIRNKQRIFTSEAFKTAALMLDAENMLSDGQPLIILPIHYQSTVLGHMVMKVPKDYNMFMELQIFHSNYNQVLELLHTQFHLRDALSNLQKVFVHDYLTSLYNRRGFYTLIGNLVEDARRRRINIAAFSIDLNGLKYLNDNYSHQEGDYAIKVVADALDKCAPEGAICARFGGDEFTVAFICGDAQIETQAFVNRTQDYIKQINASDGKPYEVSASFGCSYTVPGPDFVIDSLIREADDRMYDVKKDHPLHRRDDRK